jgi:hypothetical protein
MDVDLTPEVMECMRCRRREHMRFYGLCSDCRAELHTRFARDSREVEVEEFMPKMHVTPNAVALKADD